MRSRPRPPAVYAIADARALGEISVSRAAALMAEAGVRWVQVRAKRLPDRVLYRELEATCRLLEGSGVDLWMDDRADLASLFPVAGLHLGQQDLPPTPARAVVGEGVWIGRSTHDRGQVREADEDNDVDVVAVGPVYSTTGKEYPDPVVGLELVRKARELTAKPLVAIGGIDARRIGEVLSAGADCVAVLGAVCRGDIARNCRRLLTAVEGEA